MNKDRILLLVHMRQVLTPDQRQKLNARVARWEQEQKDRQAAAQRQDLPPADAVSSFDKQFKRIYRKWKSQGLV